MFYKRVGEDLDTKGYGREGTGALLAMNDKGLKNSLLVLWGLENVSLEIWAIRDFLRD